MCERVILLFSYYVNFGGFSSDQSIAWKDKRYSVWYGVSVAAIGPLERQSGHL